jgi:hypothetical protein
MSANIGASAIGRGTGTTPVLLSVVAEAMKIGDTWVQPGADIADIPRPAMDFEAEAVLLERFPVEGVAGPLSRTCLGTWAGCR